MNRTILPIAYIMVAAGVSLAEVQPKFDTKEVVRRVCEARDGTDILKESTPFIDWGEFLIDTSITRVSAPGDQESPAIAFDGTDFLVVWQDERGGSYDICGARVTAEGMVLDSLGIAISTATNDQWYPAVAFDGANFLVVWQDGRGGSSDIYGARVTAEGAVLDSSGIAVSTAANDQAAPAVAFDGTDFLVVWQDGRGSSYDIYGARVTAEGAVLDSSGIAVSTTANDQAAPAVAFDGTGFLVVWQDGRGGSSDIYGARVTQAGTVLDPSGMAVSTAAYDQYSPRVAFGDSSFLVVWQDGRGGEFDDIYAARVSDTGTVLDSTGIAVSTAVDDQEYPAVAFDGTNFDVVWQDWRGASADVYGTRVTKAGAVLDPSGIAVSRAADDQDSPSVAFAGSSVLVVWQDFRSDSSYDIYGARVTTAGVVQDTSGIAFSTVTNDQWFPAVAFDGTNFFVVWEDGRGDSYDIYGARVTPAGAVLDPTGIRIRGAACKEHDPGVAFDGTNYLVVWEDSRNGGRNDIYGTRLTKAGVVLDTSGIAICTAPSDQWEPTPAFGDTTFLVVWHEYRNGPGPDIYGARVTKAGTVLDPAGIAVCTAANSQRYASVAFDGTNFLVVWHDEGGGSSDIYGARVNEAGVVFDPSGFPVCTADYDQRYPAVAFDGTNFLVVWADARSGSYTGVWGARVNKAGVVLDPSGFTISTANTAPWYPPVVFDGTNFLVVWIDWRTGSSTEIYGARVTPDGAVVDTFPVVKQEGDQSCGALGASTGGLTFLAYGGWAGTAAGKTYCTYRIWGKLGPFPGVAEGPQSSLCSSRLAPSVVRSVLFLPLPVRGQSPPQPASWLLDAMGRKVADLSPGPNDVSLLPPGVYFVRGNGNAVVQKVIITH